MDCFLGKLKRINRLFVVYKFHLFLFVLLLLTIVYFLVPYQWFLVTGVVTYWVLIDHLKNLTHLKYNNYLTKVSRLLLKLLLLSILLSTILTSSLELPKSEDYLILYFNINIYLLISHLISTVPKNKQNQILLIVISFLIILLISLAFYGLFSVQYYPRKFSFIPENLYDILPQPKSLEEGGNNPNYIPSLITVLLPIALVWFFFPKPRELPRWLKWISLIAMMIGLFTVLLLQSRSSLLGVTISFLILFILRSLYFKTLSKLVAILLLMLACLFIYREQVLRALGNPFGFSFFERVRLWSYGWLMINDLTFTGSGIAEKSSVVQSLYPRLSIEENYNYLHNLFLDMGTTVGIFVLMIWLALWVTATIAGWLAYRSRQPLLSPLGAALVAVQGGVLANQLFEAQAWTDFKMSLLVWLTWGLSIGIGFRVEVLKNSSKE